MGSFSHFVHLMGGGEGIAKDLTLNRKRLLDLWKEHLQNFTHREDLARLFKPGNLNVPKVVYSPRFWRDLQPVLDKIEALISRDFITIRDEEKSEEEILSDLKRLTSKESRAEIVDLTDSIVHEFNKHQQLRKLFKKVHDILNAELHVIPLIREKPKNFPDLLKGLFQLIFQEEPRLYRIFKEEDFVFDKPAFFEIERIATAVFLGEELKEELVTAEDAFAKLAVRIMEDPDSEHEYRELGEKIYIGLAKLIPPFARILIRGDITEWEERIRELILNDGVMTKVTESVLQNKNKTYDTAHVKGLIRAFRKSYGLEHFRELEEYIANHGIEAVLR